MTEEELQQMRDMKEPADPKATIPCCSLGYTVERSKKRMSAWWMLEIQML